MILHSMLLFCVIFFESCCSVMRLMTVSEEEEEIPPDLNSLKFFPFGVDNNAEEVQHLSNQLSGMNISETSLQIYGINQADGM
jgi:hypothetical protein